MVRRINKVAVIGSGIMGGGIAAICASAGIKALLLDIVPFDLKDDEKNNPEARNRIVSNGLNGIIKSKPPLLMDKNKDLNYIEIGNLEDDIDKLKDCDWIVEVIVENLKIKQELFAKIEKVRKPGTIVTTNTSGIPINQISEKFSDELKEHFFGTHFFNPVRYMHLLELIPGEKTKQEILDFMAEFGEKRLGKGIVWAKDTPNFIGNRIGIQSMVYTMQQMIEMDVTIPEIDAVVGAPLGRPKTALFKTADLVGLDTLMHVADNCYDLCPDDESRDTLKLPEFVYKLVEKKWLGNKTKGGFYKKDLTPEWKVLRKVLNYKTLEYEELKRPDLPVVKEAKNAKTLTEKIQIVLYGDNKISKFAWKVAAGSLIYSANRIPEISDTVVEIDNAMKWGYNFEMGPFETWDALGLEKSVKKMENDGMEVPAKIKKMVKDGIKSFYKSESGKRFFYDFDSGDYKEIKVSETAISLKSLRENNKVVKSNSSCSLIDLGDGVFNIEFHTTMNALNKEIIDLMGEANEYVVKNGVGIVIGNQAPGVPGAFSAGADLKYVGSLAKKKKFSEIDSLIASGHKNFLKSRYSPIPVVAAPYGMTLGGGSEVCLASDMIVAHAELYMGQVEIAAGVLPAGGGIVNLWKKYINWKPGAVEITDYAAYFVPLLMNLAQAKVSSSAADARKNGYLGPNDKIIFNRDHLIGEAKKAVLKLVEEGYSPPAKTNIPVMGRDAMGMIHANLLNMREGGYIPPHMEKITLKIAYVLSGGDVPQGTLISEDDMLKLEREAFVELIKTENSQKMAEHIVTTGKPLFI